MVGTPSNGLVDIDALFRCMMARFFCQSRGTEGQLELSIPSEWRPAKTVKFVLKTDRTSCPKRLLYSHFHDFIRAAYIKNVLFWLALELRCIALGRSQSAAIFKLLCRCNDGEHQETMTFMLRGFMCIGFILDSTKQFWHRADHRFLRL